MEHPAPVVFVHYGQAAYLPWALQALRKTNPDKPLFFLGDASNEMFVRGLGDFFDYRMFESAERLILFDEVFEPIEGDRHRFNKLGGTEKWLKFVFRRWFLLCEFLRFKNIDSFWTFDSDTIIMAPLAPREQRFISCAATTQCRDCCLNGFIGSRTLVENYTACMLELFKDKKYLAAQKERLKFQTGLAFNEMDAFCEFRRRENIRTIHAARPLEGEFFDDALAYDAKFEASPVKVADRIQVKRLWRSPAGAIYARHRESGRLVRMITANLSWLPGYVWHKLSPCCLTPEEDERIRNAAVREEDLAEMDLSQPWTDKTLKFAQKHLSRTLRALGM